MPSRNGIRKLRHDGFRESAMTQCARAHRWSGRSSLPQIPPQPGERRDPLASRRNQKVLVRAMLLAAVVAA